MIPILTSDEVRQADATAVARRGTDALVRAAGTAVGLQAKRMLRSCYGARVAVLAGPGLNGADGRVAASWLVARGADVNVFDVTSQPLNLTGYDLIIDAAFGLGCSRPYEAPSVSAGTAVLAVDLVSGVDADSGAVLGAPMHADVTLAIGALKFAHLNGPAAAFAGELRFAGLGIVGDFENGLMEDADLAGLIHCRADDHKWDHAIQVFAGSPLMPGAGELVVRGALAGGGSMIRLASRGEIARLVRLPPEVVHAETLSVDPRCRAVVAGPGLGSGAAQWLREPLRSLTVPVVLDADGLDAALFDVAAASNGRWILTPHEGEFVRLAGEALSVNRIEAVRALARRSGCVVLLKGPTTILADPGGTLRVVRSGTSALATAGTGDVLAGLIGATLARGHSPLEAGAMAAHLHGLAGTALAPYASASDLPRAITLILAGLASAARGASSRLKRRDGDGDTS